MATVVVKELVISEKSNFLDILSDGVKTLPANIDIDVDPRDITVRGELSQQHKATYLDDVKLDRIKMKAEDDTYQWSGEIR